MNKIESQKSDYPSMQGYMEQEEIKKMATCPSTHDEHDLYAILKREHSEKSKHTLHALEWTDEPPKVPGWYWCRHKSYPEYAVVRKVWPEVWAEFGVPDGYDQWAGPIPEPSEPKE
jgi:hypothetical protein